MFGIGERKKDNDAPANAIDLLIADHRRVDALFKAFESEKNGARKVELATEICNELTVHATAEEELFYPIVLAVFEQEGKDEDRDLIWEATVEHGTLEGLIASLAGMRAEDDSFQAHVKVLQEYVKHHVREEENEIFPKVKRTGIDLDELGVRLAQRKQSLKEQLGLERDVKGRGRSGGSDAARASSTGRSKRGGSGRGGSQRKAG